MSVLSTHQASLARRIRPVHREIALGQIDPDEHSAHGQSSDGTAR